jgi:hypothetical protein
MTASAALMQSQVSALQQANEAIHTRRKVAADTIFNPTRLVIGIHVAARKMSLNDLLEWYRSNGSC